jgi:hypothetical protein
MSINPWSYNLELRLFYMNYIQNRDTDIFYNDSIDTYAIYTIYIWQMKLLSSKQEFHPSNKVILSSLSLV